MRRVKRLNTVNHLRHMAGVAAAAGGIGVVFCMLRDRFGSLVFGVALRACEVRPHIVGDLAFHVAAVHRVAGKAVDACSGFSFCEAW